MQDINNVEFHVLGFGENTRVLDWILKRCEGNEDIKMSSPIGFLPKPDALNLDGLPKINMEELMSVPKEEWLNEVAAIRKYFNEQLSTEVPAEITKEIDALEERIKAQS